MLSKEVSSTILKVLGMTRPGIEPKSPGPLRTLPIGPMSQWQKTNEQKPVILAYDWRNHFGYWAGKGIHINLFLFFLQENVSLMTNSSNQMIWSKLFVQITITWPVSVCLSIWMYVYEWVERRPSESMVFRPTWACLDRRWCCSPKEISSMA